MKYFCMVYLRKAKLAEIVYANGKIDAAAIAEANVSDIVEKWDEIVSSIKVTSYNALGAMACDCHPEITYHNGDYYYFGRKINTDIHFLIGFATRYSEKQLSIKLIE